MQSARESSYDLVMRDAKDFVLLVAVRRAIDVRRINVEFDIGKEAGTHSEHTLTIAVRNTPFAVSAGSIAHQWLPVTTGFIDTRLSAIVSTLLSELINKAQMAGHFI